MSEAKTLLSIAHLDVGYGKSPLLHDVNFQIHSGEFWFFLGANGSGKSTLLKSIIQLIPHRKGKISLHIPIARLGYVPQLCNFPQSVNTTLQEFVSLGAVGLSISAAERQSRLLNALRKVNLSELINESYWLLSAGQRQRGLLARALIRNPTLLILDEPTNGLDPGTTADFLEILQDSVRDAGCGIIFVTHILSLAKIYATHLALFRGGKVFANNYPSMTKEIQVEELLREDT